MVYLGIAAEFVFALLFALHSSVMFQMGKTLLGKVSATLSALTFMAAVSLIWLVNQ